MMHYVEDDSDSPALVQEFQHALASTFGEPIVLEIPVVSEVTNPQVSHAPFTNASEVPKLYVSQPQVLPQASVEVLGTTSPTPVGGDNLPKKSQEITPPPPLSRALGLSQVMDDEMCLKNVAKRSWMTPKVEAPCFARRFFRRAKSFHFIEFNQNERRQKLQNNCSSYLPSGISRSCSCVAINLGGIFS
ncbi:hypothetical protein ACFX2I_007360 [Malus domestica]